MTDPRATLLLVEDDQAIRTFLADNLTADGFDLLVADCARDGLRLLETQGARPRHRRHRPPGRVRARADRDGAGGRPRRLAPGPGAAVPRPQRPRDASWTGCAASSGGATTTSSSRSLIRELLLRIRSLLRRSRPRQRLGRLRVGELEVDPVTRDVRLRGRLLELSQKEFALLRALAAEPTRVFTKEELLRDVWGFQKPRDDEDPGLARLPAAPQARLRRRLVHRQRLGRRLPPARSGRGGGMTALALAWAVAGWLCAGLLVRRAGTRAELVARASHELRGPLTAALLALHGERSAIAPTRSRRSCTARGWRSTTCSPRRAAPARRTVWSRCC